jgi:ankyrin repeat protein
MLSAQRGHLEVLKFLIDKGADIDKTNKMGKTALDLAQDDQIIAAIKKAQYAKKLKQDSGVRLPKI